MSTKSYTLTDSTTATVNATDNGIPFNEGMNVLSKAIKAKINTSSGSGTGGGSSSIVTKGTTPQSDFKCYHDGSIISKDSEYVYGDSQPSRVRIESSSTGNKYVLLNRSYTNPITQGYLTIFNSYFCEKVMLNDTGDTQLDLYSEVAPPVIFISEGDETYADAFLVWWFEQSLD